MNTKFKLTQKYLKECLDYNPETGIFKRKERPVSHFKNNKESTRKIWNKRYANKEILCVSKNGYVYIRINKKAYFAHRLAFLYMEGYLPENDVDHIDRNRSNNKWNNLREVSRRCNFQNKNVRKDNKIGIIGIQFDKQNKKYRASITINKKCNRLGRFENLNDAVLARYNEEQNNPNWTCSIESSAEKYLKENNLI